MQSRLIRFPPVRCVPPVACTVFVMTLAASGANVETLNYACTVGELAITIHVNLLAKSVTQQVRSGPIKLTAEYMDGVLGKVSETGAAALIPPMHQFVRISEKSVVYGGELDGVKDAAIIDRRRSTLTLPNGNTGWCALVHSRDEQ